MADGGLPLTPVSPSLLAQLALEYGGTPAIPQVQRSQYLADALRQMSTAGQEIKSPLALGSNLLAEAVLNFGRERANKALMGQIAASQTNLANDAQRGIYAPDGGATGGAAGGEAPLTPPADFSGPAPPATDAVAAPLAAAPGPADPKAHVLADLVAGGLSPIAASGLVGNFVQESGPGFSLNNPGEGAIGMANWEGPRARAAQQYFAAHGGPTLDNQAAFTLQELHGPEAGALARLNAATDPTSAAAAGLAYERPAGYRPGGNPADVSGWRNRQAQANAAYSAFAQSQSPQSGTPSTSTGAQASPAPQPFQISTGPDPSVASPGAQGPAGASPFRVPGATPAATPGAPQPGPATGPYATPQEAQFIRHGLAMPPGSIEYQLALQKAQEVQGRRMTPLAPPSGMRWGPDGMVHPLPGNSYQTLGGGPAGFIQADPFGKANVVSNPNAAAPPPGTSLGYGPGGGVQVTPYGGFGERPMTDAELRAHGAPPGAAGTIDQASGKITLTNPGADLKTLQSSRDSWRNSDETKKANEAISAYNGLATALTTVAAKNNGVLDTAAVDSFLRGINPGMGARNATVNMFLSHLGLPQELEGHIQSALGNGYLTPATLNQMLGVIRSYAQAHGQVAGQMATNDLRAMPQGVTMDQLGETLPPLATPPQVQWLNGPAGSPAPPAIAGAPPGFDPSSPYGRAAMGLIQNHGYRFQGGHLVNAQGQVAQ